jgi:hypothetical protein
MRFFQYTWNLCCVTGKKIGIALFHLIFITVFCTLPHELGHAIAVNCFSRKVDYIAINFFHSSDYWYSFKLFKYEIRLGKLPLIGGLTRHSGGNKGRLIIMAAGLLANLLLTLLAWWAEKRVKNRFWKKFFKLVKEYNFLTIIFNFLAALWSPRCDVRRIFSLLFGKID